MNQHETISLWTRRIITLTVMLVAIIEVLDMTIVIVAIPSMMGNLGANSDQITWILTSYITASAIAMPMTGILVDRLGRKKLLLLNISGFLITSALCGISQNLFEIVIFRALQGLFGAGLVPLSQMILRDAYPPEEHGKAMAIWGIGIMVAPILGPTLGGYITEAMTWRWVFYINIPVCLPALFLAWRYVQDSVIQKKPFDWLGLFLLSAAIGGLQIFLDRGASEDWFDSKFIVLLALCSLFCFIGFFYQTRGRSNPVITLSLFRDKNFLVCELAIFIFCASLLAVISLQPMLLENILGYPTVRAGELMAPRGLASAIGMMFVPRLMQQWGVRPVISLGLLFTVIGTVLMSQFTTQSPESQIMWYGALQGVGMGMFFVPIATIAFNTLPPDRVAEASGLFSFARSLGASVGISLFTSYVSHQTQTHWNLLGRNLQRGNSNFVHWMQQHESLGLAHNSASLLKQLGQQSGILAFTDTFWFASLSIAVLIPLIWFAKQEKSESL